jgi:hypothetical protein
VSDAARSAPRADRPAGFPVLLRHFLTQFASFESLVPSGEARQAVIAIVSVLATPGYMLAVLTVRGGVRMALVNGGRVPPHLWLWMQEWTLLTVSLSVVAVLLAVQWESFVLGARDYRILGVLPVPRRTVTTAKLASLVVIVLLLHLALNMLPAWILPMASPLGYLRPALALQAALLAQTAFVCAAVVAAQGLLGLAVPRALRPRASSILQFVIVLGALGLFVCGGTLSRLAFAVRDSSHVLNWVLPVVWFRALHMRLCGIESAYVTAQALQAVTATALAVAVAGLTCLIGYRDDDGPVAEGRRPWPAALRVSQALRGWAAGRRPVAEGVSFFARRAVSGSPGVGLIARGWFALGVALTLSGLGAVLLRLYGRDAPVIPSAPLHAPAILLPFFALVGLRLAAAFPASIEANWIFRLTETPRSTDYAQGLRAAAMMTAVWPVLAALAVPYAVLWGAGRTFAYLGLAWAIARVTIEWLFAGFSKVPFTCTYQPGKAKLRMRWPKYALVFFLYCAALPALTEWLLLRPLAYAIAFVALVLAREALAWVIQRRLARDGSLLFEDRAPAYITRLELET